MRILELQSPPDYYHGTDPASAQRILAQGFDPSRSRYAQRLYLTRTYAEASKYGKIANGGKLGVVLRVSAAALEPEHVHRSYGGIVEYTGAIAPEHVGKV